MRGVLVTGQAAPAHLPNFEVMAERPGVTWLRYELTIETEVICPLVITDSEGDESW